MKDKDPRCKGCHNMNSVYHTCLIRYNNVLIDECPCSMCIVKAMCNKICSIREHLFAKQTDETIYELGKIRKYESRREVKATIRATINRLQQKV